MSDIDRSSAISGRSLTTLPRTQFSGLDFDNIVTDITQLVTENPNYNESWEDFLSSNAGRMLVELFAYISDQLATRIDWVVNENFIGTATQRKSIVRILKLIGYNLSLPEASVVPVTLIFDRPVGDVIFSGTTVKDITSDLNLYSLSANDRSGIKKKNFEAINYDQENLRYEYRTEVNLKTGSSSLPELIHTVNFYEGKTYTETIEVNVSNNFVYNLSQSPVIQNSPRVYLIDRSDGTTKERELTQVQSFLDPLAQRAEDSFGNANPIPYVLNVLEEDKVSIEFGPTSLLPDANRRPRVGDEIRIYYRVGGGTDGNITTRSINTTRRLNINGELVNVRMLNNVQGSGGKEGEDPQYAAIFGPLQIRTAQKAVTEEDYDILLANNSTILKTKSYGNNNIPNSLFSLYGVYIRPLEVWNYVLEDKPGWEDVPPSRYNDFEWIGLRLENRFNELYSFTDGTFNDEKPLGINVLNNEGTFTWASGRTLNAKNYIVFDGEFEATTQERDQNDQLIDVVSNILLIDGSLNTDFRATFSSKKINDNYFRLSKQNNIFNEKYERNNEGVLSGESPDKMQLTQDINAFFISEQDLSGDISLAANNQIRIGFDNRNPITIDLSANRSPEEISANTSEATTIRDNILLAFNSSSDYADDSGHAITTKGSQRLGLSINSLDDYIWNSSNESIFTRNGDYYFRINGITYSINSGDKAAGITYQEFIDKLLEETSFAIKASFINTQSIATIEDGYDWIHYIKKGHVISSTNNKTNVISSDTTITDINWLEKTITISNPANSSFSSYDTLIRPFNVEAVEVFGYQDFIFDSGVLEADINGLIDTTVYSFNISVDGNSSVDVDITATAAMTYTDLINELNNYFINNTINANAYFVEGTVDYIRIKSTTRGANSSINIVDNNIALTGNALFDSLTHSGTIGQETYDDIWDIEITNSSEDPVGPILIQGEQSVSDTQNLIKVFENSTLAVTTEPFVPSTGAFGNQNIGINGVINPTRGYQAFTTTSDTPVSFITTTSARYFKVQIDGVQLINPDSGDSNLVVEIDNGFDANALVTEINNEIQSAINYTEANVLNNIDEFIPAKVIRDEYNRIRIISEAEGVNTTLTGTPASSIVIDQPDAGLNSLVDDLSGVENSVDGIINPDLGISAGTYSFVLNYYEYFVSITGTETYEELRQKIEAEINPHDYIIETIGVESFDDPSIKEWYDDFKITFQNGDRVYLEDVDLFSQITSINRLDETTSTITQEAWTQFGKSIGGGDYSSVARIFNITKAENVEEYLSLFSPCKTMASKVQFYDVDNDLSNDIFKIIIPQDSSLECYGYNRITTIIDDTQNNFGNVVYEIGSLNLFGLDSRSIYSNFLYTQKDKVTIGTYYSNTLLFPENDPSYREPARRVYNTKYDLDSGEINAGESNFNVKFTKNETEEMSIFAIDNDWQLEESTPASITSIQLPEEEISTESYRIAVGIDGLPIVEIDISGDNGNSVGQYTLDSIVDNINNAIRSNNNYKFGIYQSFNFATPNAQRDRIILKSPTNTSDSEILLVEPANASVDVTGAIFTEVPITQEYQYSIKASGDYFISYDRNDVVGDFEIYSNIISNISNEDIAKIKRGYVIYQVPLTIFQSFVMEVNETENWIRVSNPAIISAANVTFGVSNDLMVLNKISRDGEGSNMPDLPFRFHFVNDRRYVDGIFDGRTIEVGEGTERQELVTTGFPLGSLDEDIYDAFLEDKKVVGVNHVFKQTRFNTFDIAGTVYYQSAYTRLDVQTRVEQSLREAFSIEDRSYGEIVARSKIMNIIHQNEGVDYVEIDYLGVDATNADNTAVNNAIEAKFDEILVLSEDRFSAGKQDHGILFSYIISGVE